MKKNRWAFWRNVLGLHLVVLLFMPPDVACSGNPDPATMPLGPLEKRTALWEQVGGDLLHNFNNMYNLHIIHEPDDKDYPFMGWFFGWAAALGNPGFPGCDAIFATRAPKLEGPWEVYAGDRDGKPIWDTTMDPTRWQPVITGTDSFFDSWHNGDPSVVKRDGVYYMAYSTTGKNADGIHFGHDGDTDGDIIVIAGATSKDGLRWNIVEAPILVDAASIGAPNVGPGRYAHPTGNYHRPSLMHENGIWKMWFDGFDSGTPISMLYAENHSEFRNPDDWVIVRNTDQPLISNWPNPDVVKVENVYFCYSDPGYYEEFFGPGWPRRQTAEAVSLDGLNWIITGFMEPDPDVQANQIPEAFVWKEDDKTWIYVNYGAQIKGDYRYDRIRMKRREVTQKELDRYRQLLTERASTEE